jgi:enterochelin esterase-like enzyme
LSGTVQVERRFSAALDMERDLTLYLPPGHAVSGNCPVIYAADGEAVAGLAQVIEPLITAGSIPPLLIVGVHSGESDVRAMEYLPHINPQRFMAHARFFVTGVASWTRKSWAQHQSVCSARYSASPTAIVCRRGKPLG